MDVIAITPECNKNFHMTTLQFYILQKYCLIFPYYHTSLQVPKVSGTHIDPALVPASTLLLSVTAGN
jgi:hypothetical protein